MNSMEMEMNMEMNMEMENLVELYVKQLNEREKKAYEIAKNHLKSSFTLRRSNGWKEFKEKEGE